MSYTVGYNIKPLILRQKGLTLYLILRHGHFIGSAMDNIVTFKITGSIYYPHREGGGGGEDNWKIHERGKKLRNVA